MTMLISAISENVQKLGWNILKKIAKGLLVQKMFPLVPWKKHFNITFTPYFFFKKEKFSFHYSEKKQIMWNAVLGCNFKNDRMISVCFQGKPFNITVIQVYVPTNNARSWSRMVLWRPTRPYRANTQRRCPFHYRGLKCKSRKSRDTWNNRHIRPWSTKWSRAKANSVWPRECMGHSKHPLPTT